jgi:hypothetical protein
MSKTLTRLISDLVTQGVTPVAHKLAAATCHTRGLCRAHRRQESTTHKAEPVAAGSAANHLSSPELKLRSHTTPPGARREGRREGPAVTLIGGLYGLCRSPSPMTGRRGRRDHR